MFVPDKHHAVTCKGTCAAIWPPVKLPTGGKAVAAGKAKASLLGSDKNPAGGRVVTYHGWPLYTYVSDTQGGRRDRPGPRSERRALVRARALRQGHRERLMAAWATLVRSPSRKSSPASPDRPIPPRRTQRTVGREQSALRGRRAPDHDKETKR